MTRVGVVIPSYNHSAFVADAVRSVLAQTIDTIELVVVDDGSTDRSPDVIRDTFAEFPGRTARLIVQDNAGAHAAIARGIETLDTPICAVLNSDDLYEPERFQSMLPALGGAEHAIAFGGLTLIDGTGRTIAPDHPWSSWYQTARSAAETEPTIGFALLVHNFSVTSGNFVFTRSLYDRLGGFNDQKFAHDWDFLLRAAALTEPEFVDEPLMRYRVHDTNTTETVRGLLKQECQRAIARYAELLASLRATGKACNPHCPSPWRWPAYFDRFVASRRAFWDPDADRHPIGRVFAPGSAPAQATPAPVGLEP